MFFSYKNSVYPPKIDFFSKLPKNYKKQVLLNNKVFSLGLEMMLYDTKNDLNETQNIISSVDWTKPVLITETEKMNSNYQLNSFTMSPILAILRSKNNQAISLIPQKELKRFVKESSSDLFIPYLLGACLAARTNEELGKRLISELFKKYISDFYDNDVDEENNSNLDKEQKATNLLGEKLSKAVITIMLSLPPTNGSALFSLFEPILLAPVKNKSSLLINFLLPKFDQFKMQDSFFNELLQKYWIPFLNKKESNPANNSLKNMEKSKIIKDIIHVQCFDFFNQALVFNLNKEVLENFSKFILDEFYFPHKNALSDSACKFTKMILKGLNKYETQNNASVSLGMLTNDITYFRSLKKRWKSAHTFGFAHEVGKQLYETFAIHKVNSENVIVIKDIISSFEKTITGDYEKDWFLDGYISALKKNLVSVSGNSNKKNAQVEYNYNLIKKRIKVFSLASGISYDEAIILFYNRKKAKPYDYPSLLDKLKLEIDEKIINQSLTPSLKNVKTSPRF